MKYIHLHNRKSEVVASVCVDDSDYDWLNSHPWCLCTGYAARAAPKINGKGSPLIRMHREIMGAPNGLIVDHISGDPMDNRRSNLRICTVKENARNLLSQRAKNGERIGVVWDRWVNRWRATIRVDMKLIHLGAFLDKDSAVTAREEGERLYYKGFSRAESIRALSEMQHV